MGVTVRTGTRVIRVGPDGVQLERGTVPSATVLWATGVAPSPLGQTLGVPLTPAGKVPVDPDLSLGGHPEVTVVGDLASVADEHGRPLPGLGPLPFSRAVPRPTTSGARSRVARHFRSAIAIGV